MASQVKQIADWIMDREESLRRSRRLEALHLALASASGLVEVFRPGVQSFVLPRLDAQIHLPASRTGGQCVG